MHFTANDKDRLPIGSFLKVVKLGLDLQEALPPLPPYGKDFTSMESLTLAAGKLMGIVMCPLGCDRLSFVKTIALLGIALP